MADIKKNATETIRIQQGEYRGHDLADIRVHVEGDRPGKLIPTRKGISLRVVQLPEVILALQEIAENNRDMLQRPDDDVPA